MVKKIFISITGILLGYYFYANKNNSTQTTRVECVNNPIIRNQKCRSILDIYKGDIINKTFFETPPLSNPFAKERPYKYPEHP